MEFLENTWEFIMEALMQIIGTILIGLGLFPAVLPTIAIPSIMVGFILWFVTYNEDDDNDDWGM